MNIISDRKEMIFVKDYNGKELYSLGISKKNQDGSYTNGYITCRFKKDVHLKNMTMIKIKQAWLDFYLKDKATIPYIFINDFEILETSGDIEEDKTTNDPYADMGEQIIIEEGALPF